MRLLVGDVGGTNARLALGDGTGALLPDSARRFRGDDHASFEEVLRLYLDAVGRPALGGMCIAVAGPVSGDRAELTNRDWSFEADRLSRLSGAPGVRLINDLTALGHATASLTPQVLRAAPADRPRNGQSLVVNAGTGFNCCAVRAAPGGPGTCLEAEVGHAYLPAPIAARLAALVGAEAAARQPTVEELFAGRGLAQFHAALSGEPPVEGGALAARAAAGDAAARASFAALAGLFGALLRELALVFMPREGMWLAGSVARALVPWLSEIETAFLAEPLLAEIPAATPLYLVADDMAALRGCLNAITR